MVSPKDGKRYKTDVADMEQMFRLIESIPSKKAEPFKQWMAEVAASTQRNRPYCVKITNQNMTEGYKQKEYGQAVKRYCQILDLQGSWDGSPDLF